MSYAYDVEVMLRANERVFSERLTHARVPADWTEQDVDDVLRAILRVIDRVLNPSAEPDDSRPVSLRGLSWIVSPYKGGVTIAFEIHSAAAVAGPFDVAPPRLEALVDRVVRRAAAPSPVVH